MSMVVAALFASLCLGYAIRGFTSLSEITDPTQLDDAKGFAMYWAFLGAIGLIVAVACWWMLRHPRDGDG